MQSPTRQLLLFLWLLLSVLTSRAQDPKTYLLRERVRFDASQPESYRLFDSAFYQSDVIMLSEIHGFAAPQALDLALVKHLQQRVGLRYYLAEMDGSQAAILNQYLTTGQQPLLDSLFRCFVAQTTEGTSQWGNREFYQKLTDLRAYNQTLPDSARIRVLGVDWFQRKGTFAMGYLKTLMAQLPTDQALTPTLDSLRRVVMAPNLSLGKLLPFGPRIGTDYAHHASRYNALLGAHLLDFRLIFQTLNSYDEHVTRDVIAFQLLTFLTQEMHLDGQKLYGLWGAAHCYQANVNKGETLAGKLKRSGRRVTTINCFYKDSEMLVHRDHVPFMFRKRGELFSRMKYLNADGPVFKVDGFAALEAVSEPNATTLIRLNGPDSPYRRSLRLVDIGGITGAKNRADDPNHTVTTDYFQYAFVIRDSPAVTLWQPNP